MNDNTNSPIVSVVGTPQELPNAAAGEGMVATLSYCLAAGPLVSAWGTRQRLRDLRNWYFDQRNVLMQGVYAGLSKKIASTPWEVTGPPDLLENADGLLRHAQYGAGWSNFVDRVVTNTLLYDIGAWVYVHGAMMPVPEGTTYVDAWKRGLGTSGPLFGSPVGLIVLDSLRIYPTGDPIHPAYYVSRSGTRHLLHYSRVFNIIDQPHTDENNPGWGLCATSRALAIAQAERLVNEYITASLDAEPQPGFYNFRGITQTQWERVTQRAMERRYSDQHDLLGRNVPLFSLQPDQTGIGVESVTFAQPPEKFSYREYPEINARYLAVAIGVDPQDVWPLSTGNLGTGTQSEILRAQARGKTEGFIRAALERELNQVLPISCEFRFKYQDNAQDEQRAGIMATHANAAQLLFSSGLASADEVRRYLALVDDTWKRVFSDDTGRVRSRHDADPEPDEAMTSDTGGIVTDDTADDEQDDRGYTLGLSISFRASKTWSRTRAAFIRELADVLSKTRRARVAARVRTRVRAMLRELGERAYRDGLEEGGVVDEMTVSDREVIQAWLLDQTRFIDRLAGEVPPGGMEQRAARLRAELWANKSLRQIYTTGRASATRNRMVRWRWNPQREHCRTCRALNGQVHRMSTFVNAGFWPGSDALECKGFLCGCVFEDAPGERAVGRLPRRAA